MHNMLLITFGSEEQAFQGARSLWRLHEDSKMSVYSTSILARATDGTVDTLQQGDQGLRGTATGMLAGSIIGLIGGPAGVAAGAAIGAASGVAVDHWESELRHEIVEEVRESLEPGRFLVIADVAEPAEDVVNETITELGGKVVRRPRSEVETAHVEHRLADQKSKIKQMEVKAEHALGEAKEALMEKLRVAREQLKVAWGKASEKLKAEAAERHKAVEKQIAEAPENLRQTLETAKECAQSDADRRIARIEQEFGS